MSTQTRPVKIYTVRIDPCLSKFWYCEKVGHEFTCILIVKEVSDKSLVPAMAVVEKRGDEYIVPGIVRTIRAEDCTIVKEEVQLFSGLREYQRAFIK